MHDGNVGQEAGVRPGAGVHGVGVLCGVLGRLARVLLVLLAFPTGRSLCRYVSNNRLSASLRVTLHEDIAYHAYLGGGGSGGYGVRGKGVRVVVVGKL